MQFKRNSGCLRYPLSLKHDSNAEYNSYPYSTLNDPDSSPNGIIKNRSMNLLHQGDDGIIPSDARQYRDKIIQPTNNGWQYDKFLFGKQQHDPSMDSASFFPESLIPQYSSSFNFPQHSPYKFPTCDTMVHSYSYYYHPHFYSASNCATRSFYANGHKSKDPDNVDFSNYYQQAVGLYYNQLNNTSEYASSCSFPSFFNPRTARNMGHKEKVNNWLENIPVITTSEGQILVDCFACDFSLNWEEEEFDDPLLFQDHDLSMAHQDDILYLNTRKFDALVRSHYELQKEVLNTNSD